MKIEATQKAVNDKRVKRNCLVSVSWSDAENERALVLSRSSKYKTCKVYFLDRQEVEVKEVNRSQVVAVYSQF